MTVETATYISQLDPTKPAAGDAKSEGDDHIRLQKTVLQAQFTSPGAAAVTATAAQLNYSVGVTSAIQTQIDAKSPTASPTFTGTPAAPTASAGTNTTQLATTAFVTAATSAVTALGSDLTTTLETGTSVTGLAGTRHLLRNVAATAVTTPTSPTIGQRFAVGVRNGLATNTITYTAHKIMGLAETLTLDARYAAVEFVYTDATDGWVMA